MAALVNERKEENIMKFKYFIVGKHIIRIFAWRIKTGRMNCYQETEKALFDRAAKYGYTPVTLD